jgi:glycosyltransferase involved in cell wall biosynthesis
MKLNIVGSILGSSGYDSHTRNLFNHLYKLNSDIKLDVPLTQDYLNYVNDAELEAIKKPYRVPDTTIAIMTPPQWRLALADKTKKFIGYCVWEGDKIPKFWIEYLLDDRVDQIWVPSLHTWRAIINTIDKMEWNDDIPTEEIIKEKLRIIPHGVNTELFIPKEKEDNKTFNFLCNKGWRGHEEDRGGVQYVLRAFTEEFSKDENVSLDLHVNPAYINPVMVKTYMDNLKLDKDSPPIKVSASNIPYNKLPALYQNADCYVCATRAESFGLDTAEAMACGVPVITTGYGGQIEHMDSSCSELIDYKLEEVKGDIMYEGIKWATPDIKHLRELMREAFDNQETVRVMGKSARKFIKDFTWDNTAQIALGLLKK